MALSLRRYDRAVGATKPGSALPEELANTLRAQGLPERERHALLLAERKTAVAEYEAEHGVITDFCSI